MFETIGRRATWRHRRCGLPTRPIARGNIPSDALQADAYAGFNQLYKEDGRIQEVACWAHVRRKFYDLQQAHASPIASEALERIAALYAIEGEIRGRPPDERQQVRHTRARPLLQSLYDWFEVSLTKLSRKSDTTAAIRYALGLWAALTRYCDDGRLEIDNNAAERALRAVALGRNHAPAKIMYSSTFSTATITSVEAARASIQPLMNYA
jgi:transposase